MSEHFMVVTRNDVDRATLSGGSWTTEWPLENIQTPGVLEVARSAHNTKPSTAVHLVSGRRRPYRVVELVGHNVVGLDPFDTPQPDLARWRVISVFNGLDPTDPGYTPATFKAFCPASGIAASSNLSGTVTDVQDADPNFPDSNKLSAVSPTTNTDARFTFDAGTCGLAAGVGLQSFLLNLSRTGGGGANPTYTIDLYQSGTFRSTLASNVALSSTTGQPVAISFDATLLSGTPAADEVEIRIRGAASATATVEIRSVMFIPEPAALGDIEVVDSDWMTPELPADFFEDVQRDVLYTKFLREEDTGWDQMWLLFDVVNGNRDEYLDLGRVVVGGVDTFEAPEGISTNPEYPFRRRRVDTSRRDRGKTAALITEGGGGTYQEVSFRFPSLSMTTALETISGRLDRLGTTGRVLWIFPWFDLLAVAKSLDDTSLDGGGHGIWSRGFVLEEAL